MGELVELITAVLVSVISGVFMLQSYKSRKLMERAESQIAENEEKRKRIEKLREADAIHQLEMTLSMAKLTVLTARKINNEKINGELSSQIEKTDLEIENYRKFIRNEHKIHIIEE